MEFPVTTLLIETSTPHGSLGLHRASAEAQHSSEEKCLNPWQEEHFFSDRGHNCELFAPLQRFSAVCQPPAIQQILVGTGPGSYSGTRVGIAVAQGLAVVHQSTIIGIPSLLALPTVRTLQRCLAIGDARRGDWWWAWFDLGKMLQAPQMGDIHELIAQTQQADAIVSLDKIHHPSLADIVLQEIPTALALWQAWDTLTAAERANYAAAPLRPLYLKPPHITAAKTAHPLQRSATPR